MESLNLGGQFAEERQGISRLNVEKAAFINKAVTTLIEKRDFKLEELNYAKFRLRGALETKIKDAKRQAMSKIYNSLLTRNPQLDRGIRRKIRPFFRHKKVCP